MNQMPLVSVLVRSIGRQTLGQTLASVVAQTHAHMEVLVVAAVPDHPALPVQDAANRLQLVETGLALHRCEAANRAIELAKGAFMLLLDDDDWIAPDHIEVLVRALVEEPAFRVAYVRSQTVDAQGAAEGMQVLGMPFDGLRFLSGNWMPPHSVLFARSLVDEGCRFDLALDLYEDWDFWLQALQRGPFKFVDRVSAFYRIHDSSGVHKQVPFEGDAYRTLYRKWRERWTENEVCGLMARNWRLNDVQDMLAARDAELAAERFAWEADRVAMQRARELDLERQLAGLELIRQASVPAHVHRQAVEQITNSRSWRVTAPLRRWTARLIRLKHTLRKMHHVLHKTPDLLPAVVRAMRRKGARAVLGGGVHVLEQQALYQAWIQQGEPERGAYVQMAAQGASWANRPLVSVLMPTYNTPLGLLDEAIQSVVDQLYDRWELCIADDASPDPALRERLVTWAAREPRIRLTLREANGHISASSNSALAAAQGEWVALLDHDDRLHPLALWRVVEALQTHGDAEIVYSDEDKLDEAGKRFDPYFKPDYNKELMWGQNMISHLGCYRRRTLVEVGGFRLGLEGSQDYDVALRVIERCRPHQVVHVPHVLYHWRVHAGSTAMTPNQKPYAELASRRALAEHLERLGLDARVEECPEIRNMNRVRLALPAERPLVSILIPTRDRLGLLRQCVESIRSRTQGDRYEIVVIDNGSVEPETMLYFDLLRHRGARIVRDDRPFNFSALNNLAAREAKGEFLCLMNNDIEVLTSDWLDEMLSFAMQADVGAVGARLWYPNRTLQHAGVVVGLGGVAGHVHVGLPQGHVGYFGRVALHHRLSAVTAACLMVRKALYEAVGGMNEEIAVAFNDVDFCLRLQAAGYPAVYTPYAEFVHHESASRGDDLSAENRQRFVAEEAMMHAKWGTPMQADPYYSRNLSMLYPDCRPRTPQEMVLPPV